jgi:hypothetical protein
MELKILDSILFGQLRPWLDKNRNEKFYSNRLTPKFVKPTEHIDGYFKELKSILGNKNELVNDNPLDRYFAQPKKDIDAHINQPLVVLTEETLEPTSQTEWFYFSLIHNESTRTINNIFQAVCRDIGEVDRVYIVNRYKTSFIELLKNIHTVSADVAVDDELSIRVLSVLKHNAIRLLTELQLLFDKYINSIPSNKHQIYKEYLKQNPPEGEYYTEATELRQLKQLVSEAKTGIKLQPASNPNAISFGFNGDKERFTMAIKRLVLEMDLLKAETSTEYFLEVLLSDDIDVNGPKIYLDIFTNEFRYLIDQLKPRFKKLNPKTIQDVDLFRSKDNPHKNIKAQTLYSSKSSLEHNPNKAKIDNIVKHL